MSERRSFSPASPRRCPSCGTATISGDRFCADCGAPLDRPLDATAPLPTRETGTGAARRAPGAPTAPATARPRPPAPPIAPRPNDPPRKRWARRHPLLTIVLVLLLVGSSSAAVVANRAASVVADVRSQSTPPPSVALAIPGSGAAPVVNVTVDTRPARTAIEDAGLDYERPDTDLSGLVSGVGSIAGLDDAGALVTDGPFTLMIIGVSAPDGAPIDIGTRATDVALARIDPATGSCRLVSLPPDTRVTLPGYGAGRLDTALAIGGLPYQRLALSTFIGQPIDRYILVDLDGIGGLVDLLGPITIEVDEAFAGPGGYYGPGPVTMGGELAIAYIAADDDPAGRFDRQQRVLVAVLGQVDPTDAAGALFDLLPALDDALRSDLTLAELVALADSYDVSCSSDDTAIIAIDGRASSGIDSALAIQTTMTVIEPSEVTASLTDPS